MPYIEKRNRRRLNTWITVCEEGLGDFLLDYSKDKEKWKYDFEMENKQGAIHSEARYLSQTLFSKLMFSLNEELPLLIISSASYACMKQEKVEIRFYFDVMNNPKPNIRKLKSLGTLATAKNICERSKWEIIYHSVGNYAPIPSLKTGRHLQLKHNDLSERWDSLLNYCKKNWSMFTCGKLISFNDYMKFTCQQLYYEEIFVEFKKRFWNKLDKISEKQWCQLVNEWNKIIDGSLELQIVSFDPDKRDIKKIVEDICFLIEARGRLILSVLIVKLL